MYGCWYVHFNIAYIEIGSWLEAKQRPSFNTMRSYYRCYWCAKARHLAYLHIMKENVSPWVLHMFLNAHTTWLSLQIQNVSLGNGYECRFPLGHGEPGLPCLWEGADCWVSGTHTLFYFLPPPPPRQEEWWGEPFWDHHSGRSSLLLSGGHSQGAYWVDQSHPNGLTDWEVRPVFKYSSPPEGSPCVDKLSPWPDHVCDNSARKSWGWEVFACVSVAVCHLTSPAALGSVSLPLPVPQGV